MLDLSRYEDASDEKFDACRHFAKLCENTKLKVDDGAIIEYPVGWANLIENFIQVIQDVPITFFELQKYRLTLYINFEAKLQRNELKVWRYFEEYRKLATRNCVLCGSYVSDTKHNPYEELCGKCIKEAGKMGSTGTWLDKYISRGR